jgi:hypothetical protein
LHYLVVHHPICLTGLLGSCGSSLGEHGAPLREIIVCSAVGLAVTGHVVLDLDCRLRRLLRWLRLRRTRHLLLRLLLVLLMLLCLHRWLDLLLVLQGLLLALHSVLLLLLELLLS